MWNFISLVASIPDLIKLWTAVQKRIQEGEQDRKVQDDLKKIQEAFNEKDPSKLHDIFNS